MHSIPQQALSAGPDQVFSPTRILEQLSPHRSTRGVQLSPEKTAEERT